MAELFADGERDEHRMQTTLLSFGYKHGLPTDVDIVLDCRFLPNPYWVDDAAPADRPGPGGASPTCSARTAAQQFLDRLDALLDVLLPEYVSEGKAYLSIAFGCTGGRHRSVAIVEEVAEPPPPAGDRGHGQAPRHRPLTRSRRPGVGADQAGSGRMVPSQDTERC